MTSKLFAGVRDAESVSIATGATEESVMRSKGISPVARAGRGTFVRGRMAGAAARVAAGALTAAAGLGLLTYVGAQPATATHFNPDEQRIVEELPFGFSGAACETAAKPPAGALASLDCGQDAGFDSPLGGHFTSFADPGSLDRAFHDDLANRGADYMPSPCPGQDASPTVWHYTATPGETAGQIFCGTLNNSPDVEWTRDRQLLLLNVHDGPDLNELFQWWRKYGNEPRELFPFAR